MNKPQNGLNPVEGFFTKTKQFFKPLACTCLLTLVSCSSVFSYSPTNFYRPYEVDFRTYEWKGTKTTKDSFLRLGLAAEYGDTRKCRDWDENKRNVLQLYNQKESSVAMLLGAKPGTDIDKLANALGVSAATATDDAYRGNFLLHGEYEELQAILFGRYKFPPIIDGTFEVSIFVPFKRIKFKDVSWTDLTRDVTTEDKEFKEDVSSIIAQKALELGNLDINADGYKNTGIGDVAIMLGWHKDFAQEKDYLKNVRVNAQLGVTIPTGEKKDEDQSLSLPLGNDGAWGIPASLGLDLNFIYHLRAGIDLSFLGLFDANRTYRMKTSRYQTDFLLLHKGKATKTQGSTWKFTLFGQAKKIIPGLSAKIGYHFLKHDEDRLSPKTYDFDPAIVNTAQSLKEWSSHSFVFQIAYDPYGIEGRKISHIKKDSKLKRKFKPHISAFYKLPVTGKRAILAHTFGGQIAFNF